MKQKGAKGSALLPSTEPVLKALDRGFTEIQLIGLPESARAWFIAGLFQVTRRSIFVVLPTPDQAESFYKDLSCWMEWLGGSKENIVYFPEIETFPSEETPPDPELLQQCLQALYRMSHPDSWVLITPVASLLQSVPAPDTFLRSIARLNVGEGFNREAMIRHWVKIGYRRVEMVEHPGEFGIRGGLVDLFSPMEKEPVRMEWTGDMIESMRFFDTETQMTKMEVQEIRTLPVLIPHKESSTFLPASLADYFRPDTIQVWDEPKTCHQQVLAQLSDSKAEPSNSPSRTIEPQGIDMPRRSHPFLSLNRLELDAGSTENESKTMKLRFFLQSSESLGLGLPGTPLATALQTLQSLREKSRVMVVAKSTAQQVRLLDLFQEHDLPATRFNRDLPDPEEFHGSTKKILPFVIAVGTLSNGFYDSERGLAVFTDEDLFGKGIRYRPVKLPRPSRFFSSLEDLKASDYVVHLHHGIGQYQGIRRLTIGGFESDFLEIRYLGGDTLYLPLDRLNLIQKYIGIENHKPPLDRLGGWTWARTTKRVKKAIESIARELLELYAARQVCEGHGFSPESHLSREFEAAFEYEETPDQLQAIMTVIRDMEQPRPMDRLICGDVGYGKTEVAMRATFKAVMDNRQVAVLVPTTLLAQQHFQTFSQRSSPFPVCVQMLSRFRTPQEQKSILKDLSTGKVDVLIGTHRLLQKDVEFRNLGLLIVDEEQRFGVTHKERLKHLRKTVDVLTLTATPIPRTLQMSLTGIRDLSIIETPPPDRLAVRTVLARFDQQIIRTAILREHAQGGQIFFVHNRIEDIDRIGTFLKELVPEVRIAVAHGRMRERTLESIMLKFIRGEYDLLLCTAIIESGLDIPRANTILVNNAHQFGLADLYQLRGRVGRSNQQAHAYFLIPDHAMTDKARKRLAALQEFCELGAGFRIAARDLEIRGAGHILGRQQSGQVAAVGFEYYFRLIEKAVQELKGQTAEEKIETTLDLQISAYIPDTYISEMHQRLIIYKRLSDLIEDEDLSKLWIELVDRYGHPPAPVEHLWELVRLKLLARKLSITKLSSAEDGVAILFDPKHKLNNHQIEKLLKSPNSIRFLSEFNLKLLIPDTSWPTVYSTLKNCLQKLLLL
jgi:transcription-repair coupling factor (superfamily II helicase)